MSKQDLNIRDLDNKEFLKVIAGGLRYYITDRLHWDEEDVTVLNMHDDMLEVHLPGHTSSIDCHSLWQKYRKGACLPVLVAGAVRQLTDQLGIRAAPDDLQNAAEYAVEDYIRKQEIKARADRAWAFAAPVMRIVRHATAPDLKVLLHTRMVCDQTNGKCSIYVRDLASGRNKISCLNEASYPIPDGLLDAADRDFHDAVVSMARAILEDFSDCTKEDVEQVYMYMKQKEAERKRGEQSDEYEK